MSFFHEGIYATWAIWLFCCFFWVALRVCFRFLFDSFAPQSHPRFSTLQRTFPDLCVSLLHCLFLCLLVSIYLGDVLLGPVFDFSPIIAAVVVISTTYMLMDSLYLCVEKEKRDRKGTWIFLVHHCFCVWIGCSMYTQASESSIVEMGICLSFIEWSTFLYHCSTLATMLTDTSQEPPLYTLFWAQKLSWVYSAIRVCTAGLMVYWLSWKREPTNQSPFLELGLWGLAVFNLIASIKIHKEKTKTN